MFDKNSGQLLMSGGSPGGAAIIHYTSKLLTGPAFFVMSVSKPTSGPSSFEAVIRASSACVPPPHHVI